MPPEDASPQNLSPIASLELTAFVRPKPHPPSHSGVERLRAEGSRFDVTGMAGQVAAGGEVHLQRREPIAAQRSALGVAHASAKSKSLTPGSPVRQPSLHSSYALFRAPSAPFQPQPASEVDSRRLGQRDGQLREAAKERGGFANR